MLTPAPEFAVSLIFVYLLLSALSSAIQEIVANLAKWRAHTLEIAIEKLVGSENFKKSVYDHALIKGILRPNWLFTKVEKVHKPAYISSRMFAQVVQDLQANPAAVPPETKKVLDAVVKGTADAEEATKKIENWFDDAMDNVSGCYKRKANAWLWVIAAVVCLALNADTIDIGKVLWNDPTAWAAVTEAAKKYATDHAGQAPNQQGQNAKPATLEELKTELDNVGKARQSLTQLPVPLGWCTNNCAECLRRSIV
jgi:hypothetical protein